MTPLSFERRLALSLAPVLGIGVFVVALACWLAGQAGVQVAAVGVAAALAIALVSKGSALVIGLVRPIDRMLFTMLIRTFGGLAVVSGAVLAAKADATLVVLVAAPIYLSLVAGEVLSTLADGSATDTQATEAR